MHLGKAVRQWNQFYFSLFVSLCLQCCHLKLPFSSSLSMQTHKTVAQYSSNTNCYHNALPTSQYLSWLPCRNQSAIYIYTSLMKFVYTKFSSCLSRCHYIYGQALLLAPNHSNMMLSSIFLCSSFHFWLWRFVQKCRVALCPPE